MQPVLLSTVMGWMQSSGFSDGAALASGNYGADGGCVAAPSGNSFADFELTGFASVEKAGPADVCFWAGTTQKSETNAFGISEAALSQIRAGLIFVPDNLGMDAAAFKKMLPQVKCAVPVKNPYHVMVEFLKEFVESRDAANLHRVAAIAESRTAAIADCGIAASAKVHPSAVVEGTVTVEQINAAMKAAATESFGYNEDEIVSSDVIGMRFGSLFDATQTLVSKVDDDTYQVQVVSWYDNENSYTSQMVRTIKYFAELK